MPSQAKFLIDYPTIGSEIFPIEKYPLFSIERQKGRVFYRLKLNNKLTFRGSEYVLFKELEQSSVCTEIDLTIELSGRQLGGFKLNLRRAKFNDSRCVVEFEPETSDVYTCIDTKLDASVNILSSTTKRTVNTTTGTLVYQRCPSSGLETATNVPPIISAFPQCTTDLPDPNGWVVVEQHFEQFSPPITNPPPYTAQYFTKYVREEIHSATQPPGENWIFVSGDLWVRSPQVEIDLSTTDLSVSPWNVVWTLAQQDYASLDNGVLLEDVLTSILSNIGCSLPVVSDFFTINPDFTAPVNSEYTTAASKLANLIFFQKSDVKRPSVSNNADLGNMSLGELFQFLEMAFQVFPVIVGGSLRLEHITYFQKALALDLRLPIYKQWVKHLNNYSYDSEKNPRYEFWEWMENNFCSLQFRGFPIDYGECVSSENAAKVTHSAGRFITDIARIFKNPDSFSDDGFAVVNAVYFNGEYSFDVQDSVIFGYDGLLNGHLSVPNLQAYYFQNYRYGLNAEMNGQPVVFLSKQKDKKQAEISLPFQTLSTFLDTVHTGYFATDVSEYGELERMQYDTKTATLKITTIH